jgi:hypothetical protein
MDFEYKLGMRSNQFQTIQTIKQFEWFESLNGLNDLKVFKEQFFNLIQLNILIKQYKLQLFSFYVLIN